jgi:V-type H+-transporting ATPase subunit d
LLLPFQSSNLLLVFLLAPYFRDCLTATDLDELNIEIIRNTLYKRYLEDFRAFCLSVGPPTSEVMDDILSFEADRRTINITINSLGTGLSKEQRAQLFPNFGRLFPAGNNALARADELEQVKSVVESVVEYRDFFAPSGHGDGDDDGAQSVEDHCFKVRSSHSLFIYISFLFLYKF